MLSKKSAWLVRKNRKGDIFHTNTIEILEGRISRQFPAFAKGRALISLRVPSVLAVVDLEQKRVVWAQKGDFLRQHDPKILENGNMLFFDNLGRPDHSRVTEVDPLTMQTRCPGSRPGRDVWLHGR